MNATEGERMLPNQGNMIDSPSPGTVTALAVGLGESVTLFVGTRVGLYQTKDFNQEVQQHWQRLPNAPIEIIALAASPTYATDSTVLAGTGLGLLLSRDGGEQWEKALTPMPNPVVVSLAFSPNYKADGIILAGTLEDGIYYTDNRGERWSYRGFGLLDAAVYALAISPNFAQDEMLFVGTETALYYSYNGARAWKPLPFPEEATPILSLALSSDFCQDQTIYAGTEHHGLYRSPDLGQSWQHLDLPATCVNALAVAPADGSLFAATNTGLYGADRTGAIWRCVLDRPDAFSLAINADSLLVGLIEQGAWQSRDQINWQRFFPTI